jgi:hypothetical protein
MQCHAQEGGSKAKKFGCLQLVPNVKLYCTRLLLCEAIEETQMYLFPLTLSKGFMCKGAFELDCTVRPIAILYNRLLYVLFGTATSMSLCFCILFFSCFSSERCNVILWVKDVWRLLNRSGWCCRQSFTVHLMCLMTSGAVVCDVCYLEPWTLQAW